MTSRNRLWVLGLACTNLLGCAVTPVETATGPSDTNQWIHATAELTVHAIAKRSRRSSSADRGPSSRVSADARPETP